MEILNEQIIILENLSHLLDGVEDVLSSLSTRMIKVELEDFELVSFNEDLARIHVSCLLQILSLLAKRMSKKKTCFLSSA